MPVFNLSSTYKSQGQQIHPRSPLTSSTFTFRAGRKFRAHSVPKMRKLRSKVGKWQLQATHPSCSGGALTCASVINNEAYVSTLFVQFLLILRLGCHLYFLGIWFSRLPASSAWLHNGKALMRSLHLFEYIGRMWEGVTGGWRAGVWKSTFCTFNNATSILSKAWTGSY